MTTTTQKLGVLYAVTAILLVAVTGGAATTGGFVEQRATSDAVHSASDFTVDLGSVGNESMDPSVLYDEGTHSELEITYDVPDAANVTDDESRFTFDFVDHGDPVEASDVTCDSEPYESDGTCTVTFDKRDLLMETGSIGDRSFVVRGHWSSDRDFVVRGTIRVEDDGPEPTDGDDGTAAGNTAIGDGMESGNAGTTAGNTGTCSGNAGNSDCSGDANVVEHVALPTAAPGRSGVGS